MPSIVLLHDSRERRGVVDLLESKVEQVHAVKWIF